MILRRGLWSIGDFGLNPENPLHPDVCFDSLAA